MIPRAATTGAIALSTVTCAAVVAGRRIPVRPAPRCRLSLGSERATIRLTAKDLRHLVQTTACGKAHVAGAAFATGTSVIRHCTFRFQSNDYNWCSGSAKANIPYHCSTATDCLCRENRQPRWQVALLLGCLVAVDGPGIRARGQLHDSVHGVPHTRRARRARARFRRSRNTLRAGWPTRSRAASSWCRWPGSAQSKLSDARTGGRAQLDDRQSQRGSGAAGSHEIYSHGSRELPGHSAGGGGCGEGRGSSPASRVLAFASGRGKCQCRSSVASAMSVAADTDGTLRKGSPEMDQRGGPGCGHLRFQAIFRGGTTVWASAVGAECWLQPFGMAVAVLHPDSMPG